MSQSAVKTCIGKRSAFTGEISAGMLVALGITHVIIGHSERRQYFGNGRTAVNLKLKAASKAGSHPSCALEKSWKSEKQISPIYVLRRLRALPISGKKAGI